MENTYLVLVLGLVASRCSEDDVDFNVSVLTVTAKCYLMAHVCTTPNLRKLDAKISRPEDTNEANVVSKGYLAECIEGFPCCTTTYWLSPTTE